MKLTLKNFRCYTNQTFEFDDDEITLISGPSGRGKTTILIAIQFALFGATKHKYLVSFNKTSCEVEIEYKNFKIKRTKRPNILNVTHAGSFYEDKEAQVIINKYFGIANSSMFFLDLSHLEKMTFLQTIVNNNYDVDSLKLKVKNSISNLNRELATLDGQISNTKNMLEIVQKPDIVEKPDGDGIPEALKKMNLEEFELKKKTTTTSIEEEGKKIKTYNDIFNHIKIAEEEIKNLGQTDTLNNKNSQINDLRKKLDRTNATIQNILKIKEKVLLSKELEKELEKYSGVSEKDEITLKKQLDELNKEIKICEDNVVLQAFKSKEIEYMDTLSQEKIHWGEAKTTIQNKISGMGSVDHSKLTELENILFKLKEVETFNSKYDRLVIEGDIKALKSQFYKSFKCARCECILTINMDTMELEEGGDSFENKTIKKNFETVKKNIQKQEKILATLIQNEEYTLSYNKEEIVDKINFIKRYLTLVEELRKIGSFKPSASLTKLEKNLEKLRLEIPKEKCDLSVIKDVNVLKDERRDLTIKLNSVRQQLKVKNDLQTKIQNTPNYDEDELLHNQEKICGLNKALMECMIDVEKIKQKCCIVDKIKALEMDLKKLNYNAETLPELEQFIKDVDLGIKYMHNFEMYKNFHTQLKKYKRIKDTLKELLTEKTKVEQTYLKTLLFKQKIIEAEHESLKGIVNVINTHLQILLEDFFSESFGDPIQIHLELISDKRPQVNVVINYKGNAVDYKSLSTGEYARVKLAFDLTFKEILGESIIMLDECTANLDQDLSTKIFNKIRCTFPAKTILVVAHQVVTGTFDRIVRL
jgi:DNA repair exonuclease SbcCD ATPase subunit